MPDAEVKGWLELLNGGGNVAAIMAVYLGYQVLRRFETIMDRMILRLTRIERALVVRDPATNQILSEPEAGEEHRA
jgi:hypothetical protein